MCSSEELQAIELESLENTCSTSDLGIALNYSNEKRSGDFRIFADLPGCKIIYLHAPPSKLITNNNFVVEKLDDMWLYELTHLPPIFLHFLLPADYPGSDVNPVPPKVWLKSDWLPEQVLSELIDSLHKLCHATPGELVLWSLVDYIKSNAHKFIREYLYPSARNEVHFNLTQFYGAYQTEMCLSLSHCTALLLSNNDEMMDAEFVRTMRECPVCMENKLGSHFFRFHACKHSACLDCVRQAFTLIVESGLTIQPLSCLICETNVGIHEARLVLPPAIFDRYEALLLRRSLNMMSDIAYCPRETCQNMPVILDDADLGRCTNCSFAFCPKCLRAYHGSEECQIKRAALDPSKETDTLTAEERAARENEDLASYDYLMENCKFCPGCASPVLKTMGCNKMICLYCQTRFCWLCMQPIYKGDPYEHFRGGGPCAGQLFVGLEDPIDD